LKWTGEDINFTDAYDDKIGEWDKQAIKYGYSVFDENEAEELQKIIEENHTKGLSYITDSDARPSGGAHADAHLWDNGSDIVKELNDLYKIRAYGFKNFGEATISEGTPYSELEKYIVPLYMMHRYQLEGAAKLLGGVHYSYDVKDGDEIKKLEKVSEKEQSAALDAILITLSNDFLSQEKIVEFILPNAQGYRKSRESAKGNMGPVYDPNALISASAKHTLRLLLNPQRLNRLAEPSYSFGETHLENYLSKIIKTIESNRHQGDLLKEIQLDYLISAYHSSALYPTAKNEIYKAIIKINNSSMTPVYMKNKIDQFTKGTYKGEYIFDKITIPPGSPIGCH
jgi:hypothetical protein